VGATQIRSKAASEEILSIYDLLRQYSPQLRALHVGPQILDMVASAAALIPVRENANSVIVFCFLVGPTPIQTMFLLQDMERCGQVLSDAKQSGFETSSAMKCALISCHAAQGETDEACKILERCLPWQYTHIECSLLPQSCCRRSDKCWHVFTASELRLFPRIASNCSFELCLRKVRKRGRVS